MLWQIFEVKNIWKKSRLDGILWIISFASCIILDLDYGLIIGAGFAIFILIFRGQRPSTAILGNLSGTNLYGDINNYPMVSKFFKKAKLDIK